MYTEKHIYTSSNSKHDSGLGNRSYCLTKTLDKTNRIEDNDDMSFIQTIERLNGQAAIAAEFRAIRASQAGLFGKTNTGATVDGRPIVVDASGDNPNSGNDTPEPIK